MSRYKITNDFRKVIGNSNYSLRQLTKLAGFSVKNIYSKNVSISEKHLKMLSLLLKVNPKLKEIRLNYTKNLGIYAKTEKVRKIKKGIRLAEIIGIILGDGNMWKNQVRIAFDKRNEKYIEYVKNLLETLTGLNVKKQVYKKINSAYLYYYNKDLAETLIKFGLKRGDKKINQLGIPKWIKSNKSYAKACIRVLVDTDGCVYKCKREKQIYIKFTNYNQQLLKDFKEVTKDLGYSFAKANKTNACLYRKNEVVRFIRDIQPCKFKFGAVV